MSSQSVIFTPPTLITQMQQQIASLQASISSIRNTTISFLLNGKNVIIENPEPSMPLLSYIRNYTPYTATKLGCSQGGCGICTVMISYQDFSGTYKNINVNSCLVKLIDINGMAVTTNDGIGNVITPHPIQKHFSHIGGYQCGYCTSGMIMSIYTAFQTQSSQSNNGMNPSWEKTEKLIDGNLCRCTGFRPIIEAFKTLMVTDATGASSPYINQSNSEQVEQYQTLWSRWKNPSGDNIEERILPIYDPSSDEKNAIHYKDIQSIMPYTGSSYFTSNLGYKQYNIVNLSDIPTIIQTVGSTNGIQIVQGQLQYGVPGYSQASSITTLINVSNIVDLHSINYGVNQVTFGSGLKLAELYDSFLNSSSTKLQLMANHIYKISGHQVRNWGSWIGGLMAAKFGATETLPAQPQYFYSDMGLILQAAGATLDFQVYNNAGVATSHVNVDVQTFLSTSYTGLVFVTQGKIPTNSTQIFRSYRQAMRPNNAHTVAHMAVQVTQSSTGAAYSDARVFIGGFGSGMTGQYSSYYRFTAAESYINGKTGANLSYGDLASLVDTYVVDFVPEMICAENPLAEQQTFRRELFKGYFLEWVSDMKSSTTYAFEFDKSTAFGNQDFVSPTGTSEFAYATNLYEADHPEMFKYKSFPIGKATGQIKYTTDKVQPNQLWIEPIIATQTAPFFNRTFTGPINNLTMTPFTYEMPVQMIDVASSGTLQAIADAEAMYGVKLVLTACSNIPKPQVGYAVNYDQAGAPAFDYQQGMLYLPQTYSNFGAFRTVWSTIAKYELSGLVPFIGSEIGAVVAETREIAQAAAKYISENIVYVTTGTPVSPYIAMNTSTVSPTGGFVNSVENKISAKEFYAVSGIPFYCGDTLNQPTAPTPGQLQYYTGTNIIGDFATVYAAATGANDIRIARGNIKQKSVDHFTTERDQCVVCYPDNNGRFKMIYPTKMGNNASFHRDNMLRWWYGPHFVASGPYATSVTGKFWATPQGPARFDDGSLVYDPDLWYTETTAVGGHFGAKFYAPSLLNLAFLACRILGQPIIGQPSWDKTTNDHIKAATNIDMIYSMAFDNTGKIKALADNMVCDGGWSDQSGNLDALFVQNMANSLGEDFNFGAFLQNSQMVNTNTPSSAPLRSISAHNGAVATSTLLQIVNETLKAKYGEGASTLSDVFMTNLITRYSPYVLPILPGYPFPPNIPVDNCGYPLINPYSQFPDFSTGWDSFGDGGRETGYWFLEEHSQYQVLQSIDRKINQLYYTTGAITVFSPAPNGYTGSPLPAPVAASSTGAFNDVAARFPAIAQLEQDINAWNSLPENRFRKLGLGMSLTTYNSSSVNSFNSSLKMTLEKQGNIQVATNINDSGQGGPDLMLQTLADEMYLDKSLFYTDFDYSINATSGFTSVGSMVSPQYQRAAVEACKEFMAKCIQAIYHDITYPLLNAVVENLRNVIASTGSGDVPGFTGAPYLFPNAIGGFQAWTNQTVSSFDDITPAGYNYYLSFDADGINGVSTGAFAFVPDVSSKTGAIVVGDTTTEPAAVFNSVALNANFGISQIPIGVYTANIYAGIEGVLPAGATGTATASLVHNTTFFGPVVLATSDAVAVTANTNSGAFDYVSLPITLATGATLSPYETVSLVISYTYEANGVGPATLTFLTQTDNTSLPPTFFEVNSWYQGYSIVATGPYDLNLCYKYVGAGQGNTGPAGYPDSFYVSPLNDLGQPTNICTQAWPTQEDVDWINSDRDLQILTLVRYGLQKGMGQDQLLKSDWDLMTVEQKKNMLTAYWPTIAVGLGSSAPTQATTPLSERSPVLFPAWSQAGGLRTIMSSGISFDNTTSPGYYWYPIYAQGFGDPGLAALTSIFGQLFNLRSIVAGLVLTEVNILSGQYNEIDAFISMDAGKSMNPLQHATQLESAYLQARSWYLQESIYMNTGTSQRLNPDTWDYKPVSSQNTPQRVNAIILNYPDSFNPGVINESKMIGEPGTFGGAAAVAAVRAAIGTYRRQEGIDTVGNAGQVHEWIEGCSTPLTINKIKNACPLPSSVSL